MGSSLDRLLAEESQRTGRPPRPDPDMASALDALIADTSLRVHSDTEPAIRRPPSAALRPALDPGIAPAYFGTSDRLLGTDPIASTRVPNVLADQLEAIRQRPDVTATVTGTPSLAPPPTMAAPSLLEQDVAPAGRAKAEEYVTEQRRRERLVSALDETVPIVGGENTARALEGFIQAGTLPGRAVAGLAGVKVPATPGEVAGELRRQGMATEGRPLPAPVQTVLSPLGLKTTGDIAEFAGSLPAIDPYFKGAGAVMARPAESLADAVLAAGAGKGLARAAEFGVRGAGSAGIGMGGMAAGEAAAHGQPAGEIAQAGILGALKGAASFLPIEAGLGLYRGAREGMYDIAKERYEAGRREAYDESQRTNADYTVIRGELPPGSPPPPRGPEPPPPPGPSLRDGPTEREPIDVEPLERREPEVSDAELDLAAAVAHEQAADPSRSPEQIPYTPEPLDPNHPGNAAWMHGRYPSEIPTPSEMPIAGTQAPVSALDRLLDDTQAALPAEAVSEAPGPVSRETAPIGETQVPGGFEDLAGSEDDDTNRYVELDEEGKSPAEVARLNAAVIRDQAAKVLAGRQPEELSKREQSEHRRWLESALYYDRHAQEEAARGSGTHGEIPEEPAKEKPAVSGERPTPPAETPALDELIEGRELTPPAAKVTHEVPPEVAPVTPAVLYHGGKEPITELDDRPLYLAGDPEVAKSYSTGRHGAAEPQVTAFRLKPGLKMATAEDVERVAKNYRHVVSNRLSQADLAGHPAIVNALRAEGFDGVQDVLDFDFRSDFDEHPVTLVFEPEESLEFHAAEPETRAEKRRPAKKGDKAIDAERPATQDQSVPGEVAAEEETHDRPVRESVPGEPGGEPAGAVPAVEPQRPERAGEPGERPSRAAVRRPGGADAGAETAAQGEPGEDRPRREPAAPRAGDRHGRGAGERAGAASAGTLPARNYRLTAADDLGAGGPRAKAAGNLDAIRLLKDIEAAGRPATRDEQAILAKYVGWGGLPNAFKEGHKDYLSALREGLTDAEYEAARGSTLNAHYTSAPVIQAIHGALQRLGVAGGHFLEPSMGVGHFLGLAPEGARIHWTGVELDPITGRIATLLYPEADIRVMGFENARLPDASQDVVVSNIPFGNYRVNDVRYNKLKLSIHNYFFAKALDVVRPGGIVAFITSRFSLDAQDSTIRQYLAERADLLGAVRLPNTAFKASAGTEVVTDVLFFQRRMPGAPAGGPAFRSIGTLETPEGPAAINEYYVEHPGQILGELHLTRGQHKANEETVTAPKDYDLAAAMETALARLPAGVYHPEAPDAPGTRIDAETVGIPAPGRIKDGGFLVQGDVLYQKAGERLVKAEVPAAQRRKVTQLARIQDAVREVIRTQREDVADSQLVAARKALGKHYDTFVREFGPIARETRTEVTPKKGKPFTITRYPNLKPYLNDPDVGLLFGLEDYDAEHDTARKMDIFSTRVIARAETVTRVDTPGDALPVVLNNLGRVDLPAIAALAGTTPEEAVKALAGAIYENPTGGEWETADAYLSGDVRAKLTLAREAAKGEPRYQANVAALEAVQPEDLPPSAIAVNLGTPWIPTTDVEQFVRDTFGPGTVSVRYLPTEAKWLVESDWRQKGSGAATNDFGTQRRNGLELLKLSLNQQMAEVSDKIGDATVKNVQETLAAQEKQQKLKDRFAAWVWEDAKRGARLAAYYNQHFNNLRLRTYDGSHLRLPGMAAVVNGKPFKLDAHQKNAIWRIVQTGNTLLAHVVGAGKTYTMVAAGMELKRLGLARKPMYTVPNHMLGQFSREFLQLYPSANILVAERGDLTKEGRARFQAKVTSSNWDAIILTHRSFEAVPMSREAQVEFIQEQIDTLEMMVVAERGDKATVKEIEKAKKSREAKLQRLMAEERKDELLDFESLGVDHVFVDEAHLFKNLEIASKQQGLGQEGADRSFDLYLKARYLDRQTPGRGLVFATGTPIANSMAEMYTMQRYLQFRLLLAQGLAHFDAWAALFGESVTALELAPDGSGYRVNTRFAAFKNVPELVAMFRLVADVQTAEDLNLPRPTLLGGKAQAVLSPATPRLKAWVASLIKRAEAVRGKLVDPKDDNFLKITTEGRFGALDLRLVDASAPADPEGKAAQAAERIHELWQEHAGHRGVQLVFADIGTPREPGSISAMGGVPGFSAYGELHRLLVQRGVPASEIAFIHDATNDDKKARLFQAVRSGRIRILIGSTEKMGAGTNVQDRLVAEHHLDAPWRPADIEQREGRILRQGNLLFNEGKIPGVRIVRYMTEGSFDAYMWQTLERKARMIASVMKGDVTVRRIEDIDGQALSYGEMKAIASGNPMVMEKAGVDADVAKLSRLKKAHQDAQFRLRQELLNLPARETYWSERRDHLELDVQRREPTAGDQFAIVLEGKSYAKRPDAAAALRTILGTALARHAQAVQAGLESDERRIGSFAGFDLYLSPEMSSLTRAKLMIRGAGTYGREVSGDDSAASLLSTLEHIPPSLEGAIDGADEEIERVRKRIADLEDRAGQPFEDQARLDKLVVRQGELDRALTEKPAESTEPVEPVESEEGDEDEDLEYRRTFPGLTGKEYQAILDRLRGRTKDQAAIAPSSLDEVEERWQAGKGLEPETLRQKLARAMEALRQAGRHFPEIDPSASPLAALTNEILLEVEHAQSYAQATAYDKVRKITDGLTEPEVDLLTRHFALADLLKDIEKKRYEGKDLPFGYPDAEAIEADLERVRLEVSKNPKVAAAIHRRQQFAGALVRELVAIDQLPAEVLKDDRYYHRQVLEYFNALPPMTQRPGTAAQEARVKQKGFQKARVGGGDFNTRYHEAEFEWVAQAYRIIHMVRSLDRIQRLADVMDRLKKEAKSLNASALVATMGEIPAAEAMSPYARRIGMATGGLTDLILSGEGSLPGFEQLEAAVVDAYAEWKDQPRRERGEGPRPPFRFDHPQWWQFLKRLLDRNEEGAREAATIFKAIAEREQKLKDLLGPKYRTWEDLVPEGYRTWQPVKGNFFAPALTIAERAVQAILSGERAFTESDLNEQLILAGARETWVIPDWLARTMDDFGRVPEPSVIGRAWQATEGAWKQWQLLNPQRAIKYNLNNFSGDLDATLLHPGILRHARQAARDLWAHHKGSSSGALATELSEWNRLRVLDQGLTVAEIPDLGNLPAFERLAGGSQKGFMLLVTGYWRHARQLTQLRENIFRLAAARYFLAELRAGRTPLAASNPDILRAIRDPQERAARLSRDLIGDYGDISSGGTYVRSRLFPFFSWQEINAKRYLRVFRNLFHEGAEEGAGPRLAALLGKKFLTQALKRLLQVNLFFLFVSLWNRLLFPDAEDELRRRGRDMHLILHRNDDGSITSIRIEGAFADFLEWIAASDYPSDVEDLVRGGATLQEKFVEAAEAPLQKIVGMWEPVSKTLFETVTKKATYPDPLHPRPIRDRGEQLATNLSLGWLYRKVTDKPTPPAAGVTQFLLMRTDPGEAAYFEIRQKIADFQEAQGKERGSTDPTARDNALYYWRKALQWGEPDQADRWLQRYYALGGKPGNAKASIKRAHPLGSLAHKDRGRFMRTLSVQDRQALELAERWYQQTLRGEGPRSVGRTHRAGE